MRTQVNKKGLLAFCLMLASIALVAFMLQMQSKPAEEKAGSEGCHILPRHFAVDDGRVHLVLTPEVSVERAAPLARSLGNVVHRRILETLSREQLSGDIYQQLSGLLLRHIDFFSALRHKSSGFR